MPTPEELDFLRRASQQSAARARKILDDDVKAIMDKVARISELKPKTANEETYNKLIDVVKEAKNRNESIATLKENIKKLGNSAVSLFKEMAVVAKSLL